MVYLGATIMWRAYVAMASTEKDRAKATSLFGLSITCGIVAGPRIIQSYFPLKLLAY